MCGRYTLFTDEEYQDIRKIIRAVQETVSYTHLTLPTT